MYKNFASVKYSINYGLNKDIDRISKAKNVQAKKKNVDIILQLLLKLWHQILYLLQ